MTLSMNNEGTLYESILHVTKQPTLAYNAYKFPIFGNNEVIWGLPSFATRFPSWCMFFDDQKN